MTNKNSSYCIVQNILEMYLWVSAISAGGKTLKTDHAEIADQ